MKISLSRRRYFRRDKLLSRPYFHGQDLKKLMAERDPEGAAQDIDQAETLLRADEPDNERWRGKLLRLRAEILWLRHDTDGARELQARADVLDPGGSMPGTPPPHLLESPR